MAVTIFWGASLYNNESTYNIYHYISFIHKKFLLFQNTLFLCFLSMNEFFCSVNIDKKNDIAEIKFSCLYGENFVSYSYNCNFLGYFPRQTDLILYNALKTETTHAECGVLLTIRHLNVRGRTYFFILLRPSSFFSNSSTAVTTISIVRSFFQGMQEICVPQ